jgi:hypothetical protein
MMPTKRPDVDGVNDSAGVRAKISAIRHDYSLVGCSCLPGQSGGGRLSFAELFQLQAQRADVCACLQIPLLALRTHSAPSISRSLQFGDTLIEVSKVVFETHIGTSE